MLAEALLDAEVKVGELLKQIPTRQGMRIDLTSSEYYEEVKSNHDDKNNNKPENEDIKELGFNNYQAYTYEKMAGNKDFSGTSKD